MSILGYRRRCFSMDLFIESTDFAPFRDVNDQDDPADACEHAFAGDRPIVRI